VDRRPSRREPVRHPAGVRRFGLGLLAWSPLARGLLSGKYRRGQAAPAGSRFAKWQKDFAAYGTERNWDIVEVLVGAAEQMGVPPARLALRWVLDQPGVTAAILGVRSLAQLDEGAQALSLKIPAEIADRLQSASTPPLPYPYEFINRIDGRW
jgi:aryl-alcohol dehydrogenase-like predicted oxidoreductase